jgi:L-rhamnose mutarotase
MDKKTGYQVKEYHQPVKRYCRTLDLKNDAEIIARYRDAHSKSKAWPEIIRGIREVGILEMEMYIHENKVFMIVETPLDFDWDSAMNRLARLPRQQEWEDYVAALQGCDQGMTSTDKWHLMDRMFYLY